MGVILKWLTPIIAFLAFQYKGNYSAQLVVLTPIIVIFSRGEMYCS